MSMHKLAAGDGYAYLTAYYEQAGDPAAAGLHGAGLMVVARRLAATSSPGPRP